MAKFSTSSHHHGRGKSPGLNLDPFDFSRMTRCAASLLKSAKKEIDGKGQSQESCCASEWPVQRRRKQAVTDAGMRGIPEA